jgi:hypothetical protein
MTLVLNCLTRDYLFQVSDRRLVKQPDQKDVQKGVQVIEDNANKNVFYFGSIAFSYTGLATIERKRTDDWLLDILPESFSQVATVIVERATDAFRRIDLSSKHKCHAFVGVGWVSEKRYGPIVPTILLISNFHYCDGPALKSLGEASNNFHAYGWNLPHNKTFLIMHVGQQIPSSQLEALHTDIKTCVKRKRAPTTILSRLIIAMRETAQNNEKVGRNLLALCLPKAAAGKQGIMSRFVEKKLDDKENSFLYIPTDDSDWVSYFPSCKFEGMMIAHGRFRRF